MQRLAVKRLTDVGIGVLTPLAEQLATPLPHAIALATLDEIASGAHKELPAGTQGVRDQCQMQVGVTSPNFIA